jgi:hypothetical protein
MNPHTQALSTHKPSPFQKNNRLYQQLLASNYLHDHLYTPIQEQSAAIKFTNSSPQSQYPDGAGIGVAEEVPFRTPKYVHSARTTEGVRISHHATQSLGSTYSIIEMDNESYSTLNLYSLSRNIEHDHSVSSNSVTQKLNLEDTIPIIQEESKQSDLLL